MEDIYNMKLHEEIGVGDYTILRVPGGWIYKRIWEGCISIVFVPYSTEFDFRPSTNTRKPHPL